MNQFPHYNTRFGRPLIFSYQSMVNSARHYYHTLGESHKERLSYLSLLEQFEKGSMVVQKFKRIRESSWVQDLPPRKGIFDIYAFPDYSPHFLPTFLISVISDRLPINLTFLQQLSNESGNISFSIL